MCLDSHPSRWYRRSRPPTRNSTRLNESLANRPLPPPRRCKLCNICFKCGRFPKICHKTQRRTSWEFSRLSPFQCESLFPDQHPQIILMREVPRCSGRQSSRKQQPSPLRKNHLVATHLPRHASNFLLYLLPSNRLLLYRCRLRL